MRMEYGRFTLFHPDGTGADYPLLTAAASIDEASGEWWLSVQVTTTPPSWTCPTDGDIPEFPAIDVSTRVVGPEPGAWVGREFALPEECDARPGCYPAWLYTTGGYEALVGCVVTVGERFGDRVAVRVAARGSSSGCRIRVVGEFALAIGSAPEAEPDAAADRPRE
jgi:hypothetical protein